MAEEMKVTKLVPWFGSNRTLAHEVGLALKGCRWVGIVFAGGMSELAHISCRTLVVNDLHRHVINLANVLADRFKGPRLYRRLRRVPFCDDALTRAQDWCKTLSDRPTRDYDCARVAPQDEEAAFHYFVACWMGRSGKSGSVDEFNGRISARWNANGGDSNTRYRSAVKSIIGWRRIFDRCNFTTMDCFDFLARCEDAAGHGIYCDPPFPEVGDRYRHKFSEKEHRRLARALAQFSRARVACRFYDHPLIRELYPTDHWTWKQFTGRKQSNAEAPEVLLVNTKEGGLF